MFVCVCFAARPRKIIRTTRLLKQRQLVVQSGVAASPLLGIASACPFSMHLVLDKLTSDLPKFIYWSLQRSLSASGNSTAVSTALALHADMLALHVDMLALHVDMLASDKVHRKFRDFERRTRQPEATVSHVDICLPQSRSRTMSQL